MKEEDKEDDPREGRPQRPASSQDNRTYPLSVCRPELSRDT